MLVVPMFLMYAGGYGAVSAAESSFSYTCNLPAPLDGIVGPLNMQIDTVGLVPESVEPNEDFVIEGFYSEVNLEIPDILNGLLDELDGEVSGYNLEATNTEAEDFDISELGDFSFTEDLTEDPASINFIVPKADGGIEISLTAGAEGEIVLSAGQVITKIVTPSFGEIDVTCDPNEEVNIIATIPVIEAEEVDEEAPVIALLGDNPMELEIGEEYIEPGATVTDNVDENLTATIGGDEVNTEVAGTYTVTYNATDSAGNAAEEVTRTVNVVEPDEGEDPGDPGDPSDPGDPVEVEPGVETLVSAGDTVTIKGSDTAVTMPDNLPAGTTLVVTDASEDEAVMGVEGIELAGEVFNFSFTYPDGEEFSDSFTLEMNYDSDNYSADEVGIYYYGEESGNWILQEGEVNEQAGTITIQPSDFSIYGVFALTDDEDEGEEPGEASGGLWFSGEGAPDAELGEEGDLYLDTDTFEVYSKDTDGWNLIGTLSGEDGQDGEAGTDGIDGATWLAGEGAPDAATGTNGDLYLDFVTGNVYLNTEGTWELVANLQGPAGEDGQEGQDGEDGQDGQDGQDGEDGQDGQDGVCDCEEGQTASNGDNDSSGSTGTSTSSGGELPSTATNNPLLILIGSLLATAGGAIVFFRKKALI